MEIRRFDVADVQVFAPYYEIMRAAELAEHDDLPFWTEHEARVFLRGDATDTFELYAAYDGHTMVGGSYAAYSDVDNTDKLWVGVFVHPQHARRGVGTVLVDHVKRLSAERGRPVILTDSTVDFDRQLDHGYRRFAERHGFSVASVEVTRVLSLPVAEDTIQGWLDKAAPHHSAYRLQTYLDEFPDALTPSLVETLNQLILDAPTGEIEFEEEKSTPELWKQRRARLLEQGRHPVMTVAVDAAEQVVAMTLLVVPPEDRPKIYQWPTVVHRAHRGHRLGMAIKAANLRRAQELYPDRTEIWTSNEEHNGPMLDINVAMGFEPRNVLLQYQWKAGS